MVLVRREPMNFGQTQDLVLGQVGTPRRPRWGKPGGNLSQNTQTD